MNAVQLTEVTAWARQASPIDVEIVFTACARALLAVGKTRAHLARLVDEHVPPAGASER